MQPVRKRSAARMSAPPVNRKCAQSTDATNPGLDGTGDRLPVVGSIAISQVFDGPQTRKRKRALSESLPAQSPSVNEPPAENLNEEEPLLHTIVSQDNTVLLKEVLQRTNPGKRFEDLRAKNEDWLTPLQLAAKESKTKCAKIILSSVKSAEAMELMAQLDSQVFKRSALYLACENNSLGCIREIINHLPKVAKRFIYMFLIEQESFCGWTPLHAAVRCDSQEAIQLLVEAVNPEDVGKLITFASFSDGRTPLHIAAQFNDNPKTLECLLNFLNPVERLSALSKQCTMEILGHPENKRNVLQAIVQNWKKNGPSKLAVLLDSIGSDISDLLKDNTSCAQPTIMISSFPAGGPAFLQILQSRSLEERKKLIKLLGRTPLKWAAKTYNTKVFSYILNLLYPKKMFNQFLVVTIIDKIKQMDRYYLDMMAEVYDVIKEVHRKDIVEKLIQRFPMQLLDMPQGGRKNTPLHVACEASNIYAVECLIQKGVRVDLPDHPGRTPLLIALRSHDCRIVDELTNAGAIGNRSYRRVALVRAVKACCMSCVRQIYRTTAAHLSISEVSYDLGRQLQDSCSRSTLTINKSLLLYLIKECAQPNLFFSCASFSFMPILRALRQKIKKRFDFPLREELPVMQTIVQLIMDVDVQLDSITKKDLPKFLTYDARRTHPGFAKLSSTVSQYFNSSRKEPRSLQHLARRVIREKLQTGKISEGVKTFSIPTNLKDYISLSYADPFINADAREYNLPNYFYRSDNEFDSSGSDDW